MNAPAAVDVHCAVGDLCPPYSIGVRNCLSAAALWDVVSAAPICISSDESMKDDNVIIDSVQVEQAPYTPQKGIPKLDRPVDEATH